MKQPYMMVIFLLILSSEARATEVPAISNKQVIGFTPRLKKVPEIHASFKKLSRVIDSLDSGGELEIYRGIPRGKSREVEEALANGNAGQKRYIRRYGAFFYSQAEVPKSNESERILAMVKDPACFRKFGSYKLCGAFHPNFALVWTKDEITVEIHICLTCHEVKLFQSQLEIYCEIADDAYPKWVQLGKNLEMESE